MGHGVWREFGGGNAESRDLRIDFRPATVAVVPQDGNKAQSEDKKHGKAGGDAPDATLFSPDAPSKAVDQKPDGKAHHQHAR